MKKRQHLLAIDHAMSALLLLSLGLYSAFLVNNPLNTTRNLAHQKMPELPDPVSAPAAPYYGLCVPIIISNIFAILSTYDYLDGSKYPVKVCTLSESRLVEFGLYFSLAISLIVQLWSAGEYTEMQSIRHISSYAFPILLLGLSANSYTRRDLYNQRTHCFAVEPNEHIIDEGHSNRWLRTIPNNAGTQNTQIIAYLLLATCLFLQALLMPSNNLPQQNSGFSFLNDLSNGILITHIFFGTLSILSHMTTAILVAKHKHITQCDITNNTSPRTVTPTV